MSSPVTSEHNETLLSAEELRIRLKELMPGEENATSFFSTEPELKNFRYAPRMIYFDQISVLDPELASLLSPLRRRLSLRHVIEADLESIKNLMAAKVGAGSLSKRYYEFGCLELGIETLDAPLAAILNRINGHLSLPNLKKIDPKSAEKLRGIPWTLLLGIETIDVETATALVDLPKKSMGRSLHLPNLKGCDAESLRILASVSPDYTKNPSAKADLVLGFEEIDIEQAQIIASRTKDGYDCRSLPRLRKGSVEFFTLVGNSWSGSDGYSRSVCFDSLEKLSAEEAEVLLSRIKASRFSLNGLKGLEPGVAEQLLKYNGATTSQVLGGTAHAGSLLLNSLEHISKEDAALLGKLADVDYLSLDGLNNIDSVVAAGLASFSGVLSLNGLESICDDSARELASHGGATSNNNYWLELNGLTEISDKAAEELSAYKGKCLKLNGLKKLPAPAAKSLAKYRGNLQLDGLSMLDDATAEELSNHEGWLNLYGLSQISEVGANFLSKHKGHVSLIHNLYELVKNND